MAKTWVFLIAAISVVSIAILIKGLSFSYVTLDTNTINSLTNSTNYNPNSEMTNPNIKTITEPPLPNSYLSSGKIEVEKPETVPRRMDLIYWIAMPAIYYLTTAIMYSKNELAYNSYYADNTDLNYIYFNTFMIPLAAAYFDYIFLQDQYALKTKTYGMNSMSDLFFVTVPIIHIKF